MIVAPWECEVLKIRIFPLEVSLRRQLRILHFRKATVNSSPGTLKWIVSEIALRGC